MKTYQRRIHTPKPYWCIHHARLLEWSNEPIKNRIRFIKKSKPKREVPIRLRNLRPVRRPDLLPRPVLRAAAEYVRQFKIAEYERKIGFHTFYPRDAEAEGRLTSAIWKFRRKIERRHAKEFPRSDWNYSRAQLDFGY